MRGRTKGFPSGMQKTVQLGIGPTFVANAVAVVLALAPMQAKGEDVLSPAAQRGLVIVRTNCSRCHAIGNEGDSPHPPAPPFRTLSSKYPVENLAESLSEGIVSGHPDMPIFAFSPRDVEAIVEYLQSIQIKRP